MSSNSIYDGVKSHVLSLASPAETRILVEPLATKLFVSTTPVREALIRLAAERIVKEVPKAGFYTRALTEVETGGLYEMQALIVDWSLNSLVSAKDVAGMTLQDGARGKGAHQPSAPEDPGAAIEEVMVRVVRKTGNEDAAHITANINDRTRMARKKDAEFFPAAREAMMRALQAHGAGETVSARDEFAAYFSGVRLRLPELLRMLRSSVHKSPA
ncbi:GntR family transcriptional regulator [Hyphococcus luteus]|uniref:HTH gntR-type domain-containing protein n=1 Tax=Hyphococcus luteus TaxID=2058213 RepID=A0A2S7K3U2_9PROT|nr:GntR family transcriptional regulator [Marinicaulis flavus]PQA87184.1 hypothetical protein CW354_14185 [Marinicaulis flavus]